jgi:ArsR family transcriptional regulator
MERHYSPGRTWESLARAFLGLVDAGSVLDIGSGDGTVAQLLAPFCGEIVCIERSEKLVQAAVERLAGFEHVDVRRGDMHELGIDGRKFDHVLMLNVLQYSHVPQRALEQAARVLKPRGRLTVVTLAAHAHEEVTASYGHLNAGISASDLSDMIEGVGLQVITCAVTSRERRKPHFEIVTAHAERP